MLVGLVGKPDDERAQALVATLCETLQAEGVEVVVDETTGAAFDRAGEDPTAPAPPDSPAAVDLAAMTEAALVVSVGGDGTFLYAVHGAGSTPILGVNLGEVGFLNAVAPGEAVSAVEEAVDRIREAGSPRTRTLDRVVARGDGWSLPPALNEVVLHGPRRGHGEGIEIAVRVDGDHYAETRADGLLVATPTGSTAYNLSEGGPLLHPDVAGLLVTPMCAAGGVRTLGVPIDATLVVELSNADSALVVSDGRHHREVEPPMTVTVERAADPARVAGPSQSFFEALEKLS